MPRDIVVIGGSAGALAPLIQIAAGLPADFPAALFVVVHTPATSPGLLPEIIGRTASLTVREAVDGDAIERGRILVARPDHHLLLTRDGVKVVKGPRENRARPAIDPLFRTAARAYGARVAAVLLSGTLNDGTYGLNVVKQCGGAAIAQDPSEAEFPDMPASAIESVAVDHVLPALDIGRLLQTMAAGLDTAATGAARGSAAGQINESSNMPRKCATGADALEEPRAGTLQSPPPGEISPFACPDCSGALWESRSGKVTRYRCHVGHAFTPEVLQAGQADEIESALWAALRALEESAELSRRLAARAAEAGQSWLAERHREGAGEAEQRAALIRNLLRSAAA